MIRVKRSGHANAGRVAVARDVQNSRHRMARNTGRRYGSPNAGMLAGPLPARPTKGAGQVRAVASLSPGMPQSRRAFMRSNATIDNYFDLDALLELPSLLVCDLMGNKIYDDVMTVGHPSRTVMETLRSRGVKIRVHWTSHSGP